MGTTRNAVSMNQKLQDLLNSPSLGKSEPKDEDELECIVEWEPVDGANKALKDGEESEDNPVLQPG